MRRLLAIIAVLVVFCGLAYAYTQTPLLLLKKPSSPADDNNWGPLINGNFDTLDNALTAASPGILNRIAVFNGTGNKVAPSSMTIGSLSTTSATETLSNKTLTSPTINNPIINSPVINAKVNLPYGVSLPSSPTVGDTFIVTDDPSPGACTSAGGSSVSQCRYNGTTWESLSGAGGGLPFVDNVALLKDNIDPTKTARFELSGLTTGTLRSYNLPDVSGDTVALLAATQTLTGKTFDSAGTGNSLRVNGIALTDNQGASGKVQHANGSFVSGNLPKYNSTGELIDSGVATPTGTVGDITDVWGCSSGNCNALTAASGDTLDAGSADSTIPNKKGTSASIPPTCSVGQTYFKTDATAGLNTFACTATNTWTLQGGSGTSLPVSDATAIVQGSTTSSKQLRFEVDGFTASTTRVITPPDANITLAGQDYANLFTAAQTLQAQNEQRFADSTSAHYVGFKGASSIAANKVWILPNADSSGTQCLASDGSLNLSWTACSGGGGSPGGSTTQVQFNNSGAFGGSANWTWDNTNFRQKMQNATSASDGTAAMLQISGTMPTSMTATVHGVNIDITSAGSASQSNNAFRVNYGSGYSGSSLTRAGSFGNGAGGSGNTLNLNSSSGATANMGIIALASGSGSGANIGADLEATGSGPSAVAIGALAKAADSNAHPNIGLLGNAANSAETTNLMNVGVYGTLASSLLTGIHGSYAGLFDGGTLPDAASRALRADATLPTSPSAGAVGFQVNIIGAGSASQVQRAGAIVLNAGYTGSSQTSGLATTNTSAGIGTTLSLNTTSADPAVNMAARNYMSSSTAGHNVGTYSHANGSTGVNIADYAQANGTMAGTNIGILANAANSGETSELKNVAGYFTLHSALVTSPSVSAAIITDGAGADLERGYNAATLKYRVGANGEVYVGNFTVATLPTCGTSDKGLRATATDANAACTFAGTPTGGGSTVCPVYCDGSAWKEG